MEVTIYHNPKCGTSRTVLSMLRERGIEPQVIEYLNAPPNRSDLKALLAKMRIGPRDLLRRRGTPYDELGLDDPKLSDTVLIGHMAEHPILMERPVVVTRKGAKICRPAEVVNTLL
ncbi:MAG: arsenate reductase (glutaredoxin) [Paracoccaceae bacterium]|nr:arsenate reductase (glutaredoxin) [Paracoccaceae bacterium]